QNVLRVLVRNLEHGRARLQQDLSSGQSGRFRSEVGVADRALGLGQVNQGVVERVLVRLKRRALESTQPTAERGDLGDRRFHDAGSPCRVRQEVGVAARA